MNSQLPDEESSGWTRLRRIAGYTSLVGLVASLVFVWMLLRKPALAIPEASEEAAATFNSKIGRLTSANDFGLPVATHFTAAELNSQIQLWLKSNPPPAGAASLKNGGIYLDRDRMVVLLAFDVKGFEVYMTVDGNLVYTGHIVRLVPAEVHIGSVPIPVSMLEGKIDLQMELPEAVTAIRVENGELVIEAQ